MPTHCFLHTTKELDVVNVEKDIKNIIHKKFDDILAVEAHKEKDSIYGWEVRYDDVHVFPICLKTHKKLDFTHPSNLWACYAQFVFECEMMELYDGILFDEEYPQDLLYITRAHATYMKYLEDIMSKHSGMWKQAVMQIELEHLPEKLKRF
jgi:hypothetical protein